MGKLKTIKTREFRRILQDLGCIPTRINGTHEVWLTPSGKSLPPVVVGHQNDDIYLKSLKTFLKVMKKEGLKLNI